MDRKPFYEIRNYSITQFLTLAYCFNHSLFLLFIWMQIYDFVEINFKSTNFLWTNEGYLFLNLVENNNIKKKLDKMLVNDKEYYILSKTFSTPLTSSLFCEPRVSGIKLDTSWTLLENHVCSKCECVYRVHFQPHWRFFNLCWFF